MQIYVLKISKEILPDKTKREIGGFYLAQHNINSLLVGKKSNNFISGRKPSVQDFISQHLTGTGISPVIIHNSYRQVNLVNVFWRDIKDYGFIVNGI